ncbi:ABC transporter permease [Rhizobium lentis]|uniref:Putative spermidine/putrescine transport system permease protein n=1 Tax=Rhizobium lentis TaxID=1138194 RepID=A0A7W8XK35_9HYPH|nr:ABC transporter permease [Rhizobium lentis]MBB4577244.1 putative spermidine/putrescine transport system permease protein [Rhizobium lentis]MBB5553807.1 putative spermidine/putrescine transport system permease protein [Rhizobium lentis]MBB5564368.1 putative spermidine/putrescine transport system permease protein [Rhizobium lentis]MBB5570832.1 putative spermidine/putrescine transport system permease protein [Rhizobium lentis]
MNILSQTPLVPKDRQRLWFAALIALPGLYLLVFLILPFFGLVRISLYPGERSIGAEGFSPMQFRLLLSDSTFFSVLIETLGLGVAVSAICAVLGFPVGYSLARLPAKKRRWRLIAVVLPMTLSLVVVVFGWLVVLGRSGLINDILLAVGIVESPVRMVFNHASVIFVLVQQFLPFMILSVMGVVSQIDTVLEEASANLGANRLTTFRRVIIPIAAPGITSGMLLVFILTISAFITPRLVGGNRVQMIGAMIYEQIMVLLNWPLGAAMSIILLVMTILLLTSIRGANIIMRNVGR